MGIARRDPLSLVAFVCPACSYRFDKEPERVEEAADRPHHPHRYFCRCPECNEWAEQAGWQVGLLKAWTCATGPRSPEGLVASAANLEGHPTPEEAQRTRFNAMKHGLFARTATFFPAKPGRYPQCDGCEHMVTLACTEQHACLKRAELFLRHQVAFEQGDPKLLTLLRSDTQAMVQGLIDDMLVTIALDGGPRLKSPEWYSDKEGGFHLAAFIDAETNEKVQLYKLEAHPLLKLLIDFLSKNNLTLGDLEMTPKSKDDSDALRGYLDSKRGEEQSLLEFQAKQTDAIEALRAQIERSQQALRHDPVLIEHGEVTGHG